MSLKRLRRRGLTPRIVLFALIPLLVLMAAAVRVGMAGNDEVSGLTQYQNSVDISVAAGELRSRLQAERTVSSEFLESAGGAAGTGSLSDVRGPSTRALAAFDALVTRSGNAATPRVRALARRAQMNQLSTLRGQIDRRSITPDELEWAFDVRIAVLGELGGRLDDEIPAPEVIDETLAYSAIASVLAPAWTERRQTARALIAGTLTGPVSRDELQELVAQQTTFTGEFLRKAQGEPRAVFTAQSRGGAVNNVGRIRSAVLQPEGMPRGIPVSEWLAAADQRIDDLAFVQRLQGEFLQAAVADEIASTRRRLIAELGLLSLAMIVLLIGGALLARSITRPLGRIAEEARRVASGEKPRPLPDPGPDEIGDVTAAFSSLNQTIDLLSADSRRVLAAVQAGDNSARADEAAFTGFWTAMPAGVNRILDEFSLLGSRFEDEARRQRLLAEASGEALDVESGPAFYSRIAVLAKSGLSGERAALISGTVPGRRDSQVLATAGGDWTQGAGTADLEWMAQIRDTGVSAIEPLSEVAHAATAFVLMADGSDAYLYIERDGEPFTAPELGFLSTAAGLLAQAEARTGADERLRVQSINDELTDLPNRAFFDEYLRQLEAAPGDRPRHVVLLVDVDRFQQVNETLGYAKGDKILREVAQRMVSQVPAGAIMARHGADEFILHVDGDSSLQPRSVAEALMTCFEKSFFADTNDMRLAASIGFAEGSAADAASGRLSSNAAAALRLAKGRAGSAVERFQEGHHAKVVRRSWLESALWENVNNADAAIHYQPIVDVKSGKTVALEALARWPGREDVPPVEFIPLAEEIGLIGRLDAITRGKAVHWAADLKGPDAPDLSLNLSPRHLVDPELRRSLKVLIHDSGIDPSRICLEITERAVVEEEEATLEALESLRALGIKLVVDDFGTGYSSFAYLTRLPIDGLKIDREFITGADDPAQRTVLSSIISLCRELDLTVTAEGVETEEQFDQLAEMGCDRVQGFLLARPAPPGDLDLVSRSAFAAGPRPR